MIEGQGGSDTMLFNGAAGGRERHDDARTAGGSRSSATPGNITMDTDDVEIVDFNALGGADNVTVNDLTGTDVTQTNLDLAGDARRQRRRRRRRQRGRQRHERRRHDRHRRQRLGADVTGLATAVSVKHADPTDILSVNTLAGTDNVS